MSEKLTPVGFQFSDAQWVKYQSIPEQGYDHRGWLEHLVNYWLIERERQVAARAWDEGNAACGGKVIAGPVSSAIRLNPYKDPSHK